MKPREIPDRLKGKKAPDALPADLDGDSQTQALGELWSDLATLTTRYESAIGQYAMIGLLTRFVMRYERVAYDRQFGDDDDDDESEAWKG